MSEGDKNPEGYGRRSMMGRGSRGISGATGGGETAAADDKMPGRARTRRGPSESPPGGTTPETGSPISSSGDSAAEAMAKLQIVELATRPGFGISGNRIAILTNHFEIAVPNDLLIIQYHVEVSHERMKLNRDEKRVVFWKCIKDNAPIFGSIHKILYDGDHICACLNQIKFPPSAEPGAFEFRIPIRLNRMEMRTEPMCVRFQLVGPVQLSTRQVHAVSSTAAGGRYSTPLNILDILFTQQRSCNLMDESKAWYPFGPTIYRVPANGAPELGYGQQIWQGLFGSARLGEEYKTFINFDVSHSAFYKPQLVLEYLIEILNINFARQHGTFTMNQLNAQTVLPPIFIQTFNKAIKGLRVIHETRSINGDLYEREYRVNAVAGTNAISTTFERRSEDGNSAQISVAEYFQERYAALKYPTLNLLDVGSNRKRAVHIPMERCRIAPCQRVMKKLLPEQTANMIKATAISAPNRQSKINELARASNFGNDRWLQEFGVRINPNMKKVEARILPPPRIGYGHSGGRPGMVQVNKGTWEGRGQQFSLPATLQRLGVIILDEPRDHDLYKNFFNFLLKTCIDYGMRVPREIDNNNFCFVSPARANTDIEKTLKGAKGSGMEMVFVVIPQKGSPLYAEVKRAAEIVCGIMTQCVCKPTIQKTMQKQDRMTTGNIALKVNTKAGGINWKPEADAFAKHVLTEVPTLILGIDVTHPGPTERRAPSIASVVGNLDSTFMRYAASIRVQKHRREAIILLQDPVKERLIEYFTHGHPDNENRQKQGLGAIAQEKPQRIIIYRDGVAEGQFQELLKTELVGIRQACQELGSDYKPAITLIIGQKRHHTRFFPMSSQEACGRAENVHPGTIVEKGITHPDQFEFYLCSHFGIQGTSRPIRYHVLTNESKFSADHIQMLTYYLSHCFARCTRPVSVPAPVYYADLACRRARIHLQSKIDFSSDTMSQSGTGDASGTQISEEELVNGTTVTPEIKLKMYFS